MNEQSKKCDVGCRDFPAKVTVCFKRWKIGDSNTKVVYCSAYKAQKPLFSNELPEEI